VRLPRFEYEKPSSIEESLTILEKSGKNARILAGGTDLLVNMKYGVVRPELVMSVKSIPELCVISSDDGGNTKIGACVTLSELSANSLIAEKFPAFQIAVSSVASKHLRNMATIGGNVCLPTRCWYYNQSKLWRDARALCHRTGGNICHAIRGAKRCHGINNADTAPALMAFGAQVVVMKKGHEHSIAATDFFRDDGVTPTVLAFDEMLTSILLPEVNGNSYTTFVKVCMRKGLDFAMGNIAAFVSMNKKRPETVRLIIGSMTSVPVMLEKAAQVIKEAGFTETAIEEAAKSASSELGTLTNLFTSAGYKRQLAAALVKQALRQLKKDIGKTRR
jgi:4-hydroxybenzoyl-CoA reductase subunit beta